MTPMPDPSVSPADTRGKDRTPWPTELMHAELCAWRFGGKCDCGKDGDTDAC